MFGDVDPEYFEETILPLLQYRIPGRVRFIHSVQGTVQCLRHVKKLYFRFITGHFKPKLMDLFFFQLLFSINETRFMQQGNQQFTLVKQQYRLMLLR